MSKCKMCLKKSGRHVSSV